ncbi:cardiolipin synthase [Schlegelella sp. S2-27]|uniref:Cardiolipin synthase n=1 Tax=Caldimonas mangrovi TaxID=2944811 RepID=A0ABT0YPA5_9BURK|nr:cardiolipin synthase [Caldimonas mangrovi]
MTTLVAVVIFANITPGEKTIEHRIERLYGADSPDFRRVLSVLLGPDLTEGNHVRLLRNGDEIFPAMLEAIRSARQSICFETFIYWSGEIGREFAQALSERARAGVPVQVLLDWLGSQRIDKDVLSRMRDAGVQVELYHRPRLMQLRRFNNRTHRKLLVVDGRIGFTGGVGVADHWRGHAQDEAHWRDSHFRAEGPVVAQFQAVFLDNWIKATGTVLHGERYFPPLSAAGPLPAQMFSSSPSGGSASMHLMYLLAIVAASRSIQLQSAYFVPDRLAVQALIDAARRGVAVQVLVPGRRTDAEVVRRASRALWGRLLAAGIEIAEYQPTMFHCKVLVVDELLVSVGSTNFDNRSFRLNDEANLNVIDAGFAREMVETFRQDWQRARPVTLHAWKHRPLWQRLPERAAALLRQQL